MTAILAVSYDNPGDISPGTLGFIVVAALAVALFFLLRSMNKHLRKVTAARDEGRELGEPPHTDGAGEPPHTDGAGDPVGTGAAASPAPDKRNGSAGS